MYAMEVPDEADLASNPWIHSKQVSVGKNSFADFRQQYQKLAPPPKPFDDDYIMDGFGKMPTQKDLILRGMEIPETGGLLCTDEEQLSK